MNVHRVRRGAGLGGRVILVLVSDLMVSVRIEEAAKALGAQVETAGSMERMRSRGIDAIVVDLAMDGLDIDEVARKAREAGASVIGFYPHVDAALRRAALRAGIDHVYPRSRFLKELPLILRESLQA